MTHLLLQQRNSGFYSDFNLIVASLMYFYDNKIENFNVFWTNSLYKDSTTNILKNIFLRTKKYFNIQTNLIIFILPKL